MEKGKCIAGKYFVEIYLTGLTLRQTAIQKIGLKLTLPQRNNIKQEPILLSSVKSDLSIRSPVLALANLLQVPQFNL